jgi:two-component system, LytTR family, sensor kinase
MKAPELFDLFDQRKPLSHISFLIFSLLVTLIVKATGGEAFKSSYDSISMFVMIFVQIEVFIYFGNILFGKLNFDKSPGEITWIVLSRFMIFIVACLVVSLILYIILKFVLCTVIGGDFSRVIPDFFTIEVHSWFNSTIKGLTLGAIIFIVLLWQTSLRREQKLREENLIFQNETLKSQVNPHFLFNSLNTISSLISSQPETAERFINSLSSVYRYILENGRKDMVPLQSELDFVEAFYSLHRVRDEEKIRLTVETPGADQFKILPVSLQILLENAIKHNMATRENPLRISIYLEDQVVVVKNNLQRKATQLKSTGIGLKNLAERTRLITGKDPVVSETIDSFIVKLPLIK